MAVITLARQIGSGGQTIARLLAERLGLDAYDRQRLATLAAAQDIALPLAFTAFTEEQFTGTTPVTPLYLSFGELEFDRALRGATGQTESYEADSFLEALAHERRAILLTLASLTFSLAAQDGVILVGAGSEYLLVGIPGVLRVRIVAPPDLRAHRLVEAFGLTPDDAHTAVERSDRGQHAFNRAIFQADEDDPLAWDLVLNTESLDAPAACEAIIAALGGSEKLVSIPQQVRALLACAGAINRTLRSPAFLTAWIHAVPTPDQVLLQGDAATAEQAAEAIAVAKRLSDGLQVDHQLTVCGQPFSP